MSWKITPKETVQKMGSTSVYKLTASNLNSFEYFFLVVIYIHLS